MTMDNLPPPPPYSESDQFSSAGARTPTTSTSSAQYHHRTQSNASSNPPQLNDRSVASSITDSIIYTPPETPEESVHPFEAMESDHISQPSLDAYFDSRPIIETTYDTLLIHEISINPTSELSDLPFPQPEHLWQLRGLTRQDWATFVNYLIPNHTRSSNARASDQKTKADLIDGRMYRLSLRDNRTKESRDGLDAQFNSSPDVTPKSIEIDESEVRRHIDQVVLDWNVRFFSPRGLQIQNSASASAPHLPTTRPIPIVPENSRPEGSSQRGLLGGIFGGLLSGRGGENQSTGIVSNQRGFTMGGPNGIVFTPNSISMGGPQGIVADQHGFRMGSRINHSNDVRYPFRAHEPEYFHESHGHGRGRVRGRGRGRGRGRQTGRYGNHERSSSSSSSSSNSSSSSEESVGSLIDYDRVSDGSLAVAKRSLIEWLNHPDQPITRDAIKQLNSNIRRAPMQPTDEGKSIKDVRKELKALMKQFKELKKAQKSERRALERERRTTRRAEKRQARAARKEARRTKKAEKRGKNRAIHDSSSSSSDEGPVLVERFGCRRPRAVPGVLGANLGQIPRADMNQIIAGANRMQAEANRIGAGANRMQGEINQMIAQAKMPGMDETGRIRMLEIAERLKETQEMLWKEKERLEMEVRRLMSGEGPSPVGEQENGVVNTVMT